MGSGQPPLWGDDAVLWVVSSWEALPSRGRSLLEAVGQVASEGTGRAPCDGAEAGSEQTCREGHAPGCGQGTEVGFHPKGPGKPLRGFGKGCGNVSTGKEPLRGGVAVL